MAFQKCHTDVSLQLKQKESVGRMDNSKNNSACITFQTDQSLTLFVPPCHRPPVMFEIKWRIGESSRLCFLRTLYNGWSLWYMVHVVVLSWELIILFFYTAIATVIVHYWETCWQQFVFYLSGQQNQMSLLHSSDAVSSANYGIIVSLHSNKCWFTPQLTEFLHHNPRHLCSVVNNEIKGWITKAQEKQQNQNYYLFGKEKDIIYKALIPYLPWRICGVKAE